MYIRCYVKFASNAKKKKILFYLIIENIKTLLRKIMYVRPVRQLVLENKDKIIKRSADRRNKSNISTKNRLFVLECLSAGCVDCGEKDILTLDFDHIKDKCSEISTLISRCVSFKKLKDEISKCEVRCANCHRRKTYQQINCWRFKYV